mmetsp:Transcript_33837/g.99733  ORF Transcript_33837/g.99733 Transcript_33837/m.99733 type:complete len:223 (+) Transcript_33837:394-1062(+)
MQRRRGGRTVRTGQRGGVRLPGGRRREAGRPVPPGVGPHRQVRRLAVPRRDDTRFRRGHRRVPGIALHRRGAVAVGGAVRLVPQPDLHDGREAAAESGRRGGLLRRVRRAPGAADGRCPVRGGEGGRTARSQGGRRGEGLPRCRGRVADQLGQDRPPAPPGPQGAQAGSVEGGGAVRGGCQRSLGDQARLLRGRAGLCRHCHPGGDQRERRPERRNGDRQGH